MHRFLATPLLAVLFAGAAHAAIDLPAIDESTAFRPGQTLHLPDLAGGAGRETDLTLVNLGSAASHCTVAFTGPDGAALGPAVTVELEAKAYRYFDDVLSTFVDAGEVAGAKAAVSCTQPFQAFAIILDGSAGSASPVAAQESATCGGNVVCFDAKGVVHQPTPAVPVKRVAFLPPAGIYGRVTLSLNVTLGNWYKADPDGKHLIYWFVLNRNLDMLGMLYFRGPDAYTALARYGVGLTHPKKIKLVKKFQTLPGHTYRCENDLDMTNGVIKINVTDLATGQNVQLRGAANVRQLTVKPGDKLIVDMAFPEGKTPDEVPAYGWTFQDVHIEAIKK
jgi:hypothetical protein